MANDSPLAAREDSIETRVSLDVVRYANCWEDADILCEGLRVRPGTRVISIASAGDNSLALLAEGAEVVAADLSSAQLACLELRCAAFRNFEYSEVLAFLGIRQSEDRLAQFAALKGDISPSARAFWGDRLQQVREGIIHAGQLEGYFKTFRRRVLPLIHRRRTIERLLERKDLNALHL